MDHARSRRPANLSLSAGPLGVLLIVTIVAHNSAGSGPESAPATITLGWKTNSSVPEGPRRLAGGVSHRTSAFQTDPAPAGAVER